MYNDCEVNFEFYGNGFANGVHQQPAFARYGKEDTYTEYQLGMVGTGIRGHQEATRQNRTWKWLFKSNQQLSDCKYGIDIKWNRYRRYRYMRFWHGYTGSDYRDSGKKQPLIGASSANRKTTAEI